MKTEHAFGSRSPEERLVLSGNPKQYPANRRWLCDNPFCQKVSHYAPYCPNNRLTWKDIFQAALNKIRNTTRP